MVGHCRAELAAVAGTRRTTKWTQWPVSGPIWNSDGYRSHTTIHGLKRNLAFAWLCTYSRSMATIPRNKLNSLYTRLAPGTPLTSEDLAGLGISADLAVHYVRAGWLSRLARGVYCRPERHARIGSQPGLATTQVRRAACRRQVRARLVWRAPLPVPAARPAPVRLDSGAFADWFTDRFPAEYHRKRLFDEQPGGLLHVGPFEKRSGAPQVSAPERALLEVLSEVGVRQPLQEARELVESTYSLRADVLRELLKHCSSVKTVRLCLQLGRELSLSWAAKLDPAQLPMGSNRPWVSRSADGLLVLKP